MRRWPALVGLTLLGAICGPGSLPLLAQTTPFDMSPERQRLDIPERPVRTPAPAAPAPAAPAAPAPTPAAPPAPAAPAAPAPTVRAPEPVVPAAPSPPRMTRRPLVPFEAMSLAGETDERAWAVTLTQEQAAATARLSVGFRNAVVVAPEISRLEVFINGELVIDTPVGVSDRTGIVTADLRPGLLRSGANLVRFRAEQRHRTDCSIQSTYELWTEIDQSATFIAFEGPDAGRLHRIGDIGALGVDTAGVTSIELVVPSLGQPAITAPMIRLAEGLALIAGMPNQEVRVRTGAPGAPVDGPGRLSVALGTAPELGAVLAALPDGATSRPLTGFIDDPRLGNSTLVVTGPTWEAVEIAIEGIVGTVDRTPGADRAALSMQSARMPEPPVIASATSLTLAQLGVRTHEFAGRRFRTDFAFGLPADFYATAYGEVSLLLDAAYSAEVLPGSHIDVYVNDNIAATVPITSEGGAILRHLPISVTMQHMKPGANVITLEAVLMTAADAACLPGATALGESRFVLFDTSELVVPRYARIGQEPNLAALAGMGFPYDADAQPLPTLIGGGQPETLSAAATLLARLSVAAGRPIAIDSVMSPAGIGNGPALFIGPISQMPPGVLTTVGLPEALRSDWSATPQRLPTLDQGGTDTRESFERWRDRLAEGGWRGQVSSFEDWLVRNFDISLGTLRLMPGVQTEFTPPAGASLIIAQNVAPGGVGAWTMIAAPSETQLDEGIRAVTTAERWRQIDGSISTYQAATGTIESREIGAFRFLETQPLSIGNMRLVAANWLSDNILAFSALLLLSSVLLGLSTIVLLNTLGRKSP